MTRKANLAEYSTRMHRVLEHIDRHLDQDLDLRALARVAHFSAFHFHRVFFAWTGETVGDYLRRRRLEIAAVRLAGQPKLSVLNVAVSVGFGSTESFAQAFKARFGSTASAWRAGMGQRRNSGQELRNPGQVRGSSGRDNVSTFPTGAAMKVKVIERAPVKIAYLTQDRWAPFDTLRWRRLAAYPSAPGKPPRPVSSRSADRGHRPPRGA